MNYTHLFDIQWDDSYNDPDFGVPGTMEKWLDRRSKKDIERLAEMLEFLAGALRNRVAPFDPLVVDSETSQKTTGERMTDDHKNR